MYRCQIAAEQSCLSRGATTVTASQLCSSFQCCTNCCLANQVTLSYGLQRGRHVCRTACPTTSHWRAQPTACYALLARCVARCLQGWAAHAFHATGQRCWHVSSVPDQPIVCRALISRFSAVSQAAHSSQSLVVRLTCSVGKTEAVQVGGQGLTESMAESLAKRHTRASRLWSS